ncbi:hypothetical protein J7382_18305 [Shimia sp. R11_0]|uniref:hypothetical protein n=1 Tax=Shimia sp. R11_0 TaxID=2821096 RepID=UPI001AD99BB4|nr:hypothetical protein [Shimia sp. R11_0]MBO9479502.1 hypothetical protein [Shimia sp. R11_0]
MEFRRSLSKVSLGGVPQPSTPIGHVVIGCITSGCINANGKGSKDFLPVFCRTLRRLGWATHFCTSIAQIKRTLARYQNSVLINLYGEDHHNIDTPAMREAEQQAAIVFNSAKTGALISDKQKALDHLTRFGVPMPPPPAQDEQVFSNTRFGCNSSGVELLKASTGLDAERYNRAFVDTTRYYNATAFYTSVRLACVADEILVTLVRAYPTNMGSPVARGVTNVLNPKLLEHLYQELVEQNQEELKEIAKRVFHATGPCFSGHDIVIAHNTGEIFVCETGFKFDNTTERAHLAPILKDLPFLENFADPDHYAQIAAKTFSNWCTDKLSLTQHTH